MSLSQMLPQLLRRILIRHSTTTAAVTETEYISARRSVPATTTTTTTTTAASHYYNNKNYYNQSLNKQLHGLVPRPESRDFSPLHPRSPTSDPFPPQIRHAITLRTLMAANLHLGHAAASFNRNMLAYIHGKRAGIHIINLEHTLVQLRRAIGVAREVAMRGGIIVFVGTKKTLHKVAFTAAQRADAYFVTKWVGGTLTNKERVLRRSTRFDPDKIAQTAFSTADVTAAPAESESGGDRDRKAVLGNRQPEIQIPDLIIILDMPNNLAAVREANQLNIPVIAICDTDCDPTVVPYPIAANDDSLTGIELIAGVLSLACREGIDTRERIRESKRLDIRESKRFDR